MSGLLGACDATRCQLGHDWVFATVTGKPIHHRTGHEHWKDLLREAGSH